jgi:PAS domain S-box-containing protein
MFSIDATLAVNLLESAPDALVVVDEAGRVVLVNRRAEELFGRARGELVGTRADTLRAEHGAA